MGRLAHNWFQLRSTLVQPVWTRIPIKPLLEPFSAKFGPILGPLAQNWAYPIFQKWFKYIGWDVPWLDPTANQPFWTARTRKHVKGPFPAKFGPFWVIFGPPNGPKLQKRRDVVETQLNRPRGIQNNHFWGQNPKSLMTPPYYTALGHCVMLRITTVMILSMLIITPLPAPLSLFLQDRLLPDFPPDHPPFHFPSLSTLSDWVGWIVSWHPGFFELSWSWFL